MPIACTINLIYISQTCASSCSTQSTLTLTVVKDGVDQTMTCAVTSSTSANTSVTQSCTSNPVSLSAGSLVGLKWVQTSGTPVNHFGSSMRCQ